jgi:hypothetical protein
MERIAMAGENGGIGLKPKPLVYDLRGLGEVKKRDTLSGRREGEEAQRRWHVGETPDVLEAGVVLKLPSSVRVFTPSFFMGLLAKLATRFPSTEEARSRIELVGASEITRLSFEHALTTLLSRRSPLGAFASKSGNIDAPRPMFSIRRRPTESR